MALSNNFILFYCIVWQNPIFLEYYTNMFYTIKVTRSMCTLKTLTVPTAAASVTLVTFFVSPVLQNKQFWLHIDHPPSAYWAGWFIYSADFFFFSPGRLFFICINCHIVVFDSLVFSSDHDPCRRILNGWYRLVCFSPFPLSQSVRRKLYNLVDYLLFVACSARSW